jgi:dihydrofolate synthase/folylpolyglutamate synthase
MHMADLNTTLARLNELTDWERRPRVGMRVGLESMVDLMLRLGNPHRSFRSVHVGGTKGKGSVCALVEAALFQAGHRVGRYSSPHLQHVTERVSINQSTISESDLALHLTVALSAFEDARRRNTAAAAATWFDLLTAAAFLSFEAAAIDWAVIEVGLGGRRDSTNVIDAEVAVITNVELEHTEVLGSTRSAIAREKVGILKKGAVLITPIPTDDAAGFVLHEQAGLLGCPVLRTGPCAGSTIDGRNAELAGLVLDHLGEIGVQSVLGNVTPRPVGAWLLDQTVRSRARLPGRMERLNVESICETGQPPQSIPVILDGAHVPFNLDAVMRDLRSGPEFDISCVAVVALANDKDARGMLRVMSQHASHIVFTELPGTSRGHDVALLETIAGSLGVTCETLSDPLKAFERAIDVASKRGLWVIVTGSLHLVGSIRNSSAVASAMELDRKPGALRVPDNE